MKLQLYTESQWWFALIYMSLGQLLVPLLFNWWLYLIVLDFVESELNLLYVHFATGLMAFFTMIIGISRFMPILVPYAITQIILTGVYFLEVLMIMPTAFSCFYDGCAGEADAWVWNVYSIFLLADLAINIILAMIPFLVLIDTTRKKMLIKKKLRQQTSA